MSMATAKKAKSSAELTTDVTPTPHDAELRQKVRKALVATGRRPLWQVRLSVHEGFLVLRGCVGTYYEKQLAQETAKSVVGAEALRNEIVVCNPDELPTRERSTMSNPMGDTARPRVNGQHHAAIGDRAGQQNNGWRGRSAEQKHADLDAPEQGRSLRGAPPPRTKADIAGLSMAEIQNMNREELAAVVRAADVPLFQNNVIERLQHRDSATLRRLAFLARRTVRNQGY